MPNTFNPGDVFLESFEISKLDGPSQKVRDLLDQVMSIDIYESILSPIILGRVRLSDSVNFRERYPIMGNYRSMVTLQFSTTESEDRNLRKFELLIVDVENVVFNNEAKSSEYDLVLASIETTENARKQINTPFRGAKIDQYISSIMRDSISTNKPLNIFSTKGVQNLDLNTLKPFQAIDFMRRKAVSDRYVSSTYCFYENIDGFNFYPIEHLLESSQFKLRKVNYYYDTDIRTDITKTDYKNILAYKHITQQSTGKLIQEGALNNITYTVDLLTRRKSKTQFELKNEIGNFKYADSIKIDPVTNEFSSKYGAKPSTTYSLIKNSSDPDTFIENKIGHNRAFTQLLMQNIIRVVTWGNSALTAGYRISCNIPASEGFTTHNGKSLISNSKYVSGEFLISHVRHMFNKQQFKLKYTNSIELIKNTYGEAGSGRK